MDLTYLKTLLGFVSNRTHDTTTSILAYWEVLEYFQELSFPQASKSGLPEDEVRVRYVRSEDELKYFIYAPYRVRIASVCMWEVFLNMIFCPSYIV